MFKNAKVGDRVFDILIGWGVIDEINEQVAFPVSVNFDGDFYSGTGKVYTFDGFATVQDKMPRLFWDEIKFEVPEKPFDLKAEFDNLEVKKFEFNKENYVLIYNHATKKWEHDDYCTIEDFYLFFKYKNLENFIELLNRHKITPEQLRPLMLEKLKEVYGG